MKDYRLKRLEVEQPPTLTWSQIAGLFNYVRHQWIWLVTATLSIVGSTLAGVGIPYFIVQAVDMAIPTRDISCLTSIVWIAGMLALIALVLGFVQAYVLGRLSQGFLFRLRSDLFNKLQELPQAFFTQNKTGDLLSRLNNDSDKMAQFFSSGINRWLSNLFSLMGIFGFMFALSPWLSLTLLAVSGFSLYLTSSLSGVSRWLSRASLASLAAFSSVVSENLTAFKAVILFNKRDDWIESLTHANEVNARASFESGIMKDLFSFLYMVLGNLTQVVILTVGVVIFTLGDSTIGVLIGFLSYTQRFYASLGQLGSVWGEAQLALTAWERLRVLLELETHLKATRREEKSIAGAPLLLIDHVTFGYEEGYPILKDMSLTFESGRTYAIVGPTGGGKSTTVALMARLIDPWTGVVRLDGRDLRSLDPHEVARDVGVILQDPFLFQGTLGDNLRYGNIALQKISDEALVKVIDGMGLSRIIKVLGGDLGRRLDDTTAVLSLGQKQLVSFTRAVLRRPKLLILDEATANVDTRTERLLEEVLKTLESSTTQVIIAHRLATIERADEVVFINQHYVRSGLSHAQALELVQGATLGS